MGVSELRCDLCGAGQPTVRYTEIDEGRVTKRTICRTCAHARGLLDEPPQAVAVLQKLLQATAATPAPAAEPVAAEPERTCDACHWSLAAFRRTGRLGCPDCWTTFEAQLLPVLRQVQPQLQHVGKAPRTQARQAELRQRAADLRGELERAVRGEDYERAARLRDEIRTVEQAQSDAARRGESTGNGAS